MINTIRFLRAAILAIGLFTTTAAQAILLFSIDTENDRLMQLDSATGAVTDIGPLGDDAFDIDLALTEDGRLWGLNTNGGVRVDL